jgi:hypothetical protein
MRRLRVWLALGLMAGCVTPESGTLVDAAAAGGAVADGGVKAEDGGALPATMPIPGFDLQPRQGGWWEFGSSFDWSGANRYHHDSKFLLSLGAPTTIAGVEAFPVTLTVLSGDASNVVFPWRFFSFAGQRIRASSDGTTLVTLFDAVTRLWPAASGGLFNNLHAGKYVFSAMTAPPPMGSPFLTGFSWRVTGLAAASHDCDVIPGYGPICDTEPYPPTYLGADYFREGIGPIGSFSLACAAGCYTHHVGLLDSSLAGDRPAPLAQAPDAGSVAGVDAGATPDAPASGPEAGPGPCVDLQNVAAGVLVIATAGTPPAPLGRVISDGLYVTTAVKVYGTSASPGTRTDGFGGAIRVTGPTLQVRYAGSGVAAFEGKGTFTVTGGNVSVSYSCSTSGPMTSSFAFTATQGVIDITSTIGGYTTVATYVRQ